MDRLDQRADHPLIVRWPKLRGALDYVSLGDWPTPIEPLSGLTDRSDSQVWVKREDKSASDVGGNKVRKLELLLSGETCPVVTFGPWGSHHVLATAVHSRALGRSCTAVLVPQHPTAHHCDVHALIEEHCSRVIHVARPVDSGRQLADWGRALMRSSRRLRVIPPGGTSPGSTLGFVGAGLEIGRQVDEGVCPAPTRLYVALGTGGTAAGLALGLALAGLATEVVAVRVASRIAGNRRWLDWLAQRAWRRLTELGVSSSYPRLNIRIDHRFIGPGYTHPTRPASDAVERASALGLALETTYTGKTFAALLADLKADPTGGPQMLLNSFGPVDHLLEPPVRAEER